MEKTGSALCVVLWWQKDTMFRVYKLKLLTILEIRMCCERVRCIHPKHDVPSHSNEIKQVSKILSSKVPILVDLANGLVQVDLGSIWLDLSKNNLLDKN